jgi:hypothetical protein
MQTDGRLLKMNLIVCSNSRCFPGLISPDTFRKSVCFSSIGGSVSVFPLSLRYPRSVPIHLNPETISNELIDRTLIFTVSAVEWWWWVTRKCCFGTITIFRQLNQELVCRCVIGGCWLWEMNGTVCQGQRRPRLEQVVYGALNVQSLHSGAQRIGVHV